MRAPTTILPLELSGLGFAADGRKLLTGISERIEAGCRTVIMGPNGAGKSLLLRLCHGLLAPTEGTVRWHGAAGADPRLLRRRQAMVFQRPVLLRRSALANLRYVLALRRVPRRERDAQARASLALFGLSDLADRPARLLSVGQQQRLALARAWAAMPEVLFLDEPTAALDPAAALAVEKAVDAFHAAGTKIVMTTHDVGQARRLADEVIFLARGRLIERGDAARFFAAPTSAEALAFLTGEIVV